MDIMISSILEQILAGLGIITAAIIVAGIRYLLARIKDGRLREYGELLATFAEAAVRAVAQERGDTLKAASPNGKLSPTHREELKASAMELLKSMTPDAVAKFMTRNKADIDAMMGAMIEAAVRDSKGGAL